MHAVAQDVRSNARLSLIGFTLLHMYDYDHLVG